LKDYFYRSAHRRNSIELSKSSSKFAKNRKLENSKTGEIGRRKKIKKQKNKKMIKQENQKHVPDEIEQVGRFVAPCSRERLLLPPSPPSVCCCCSPLVLAQQRSAAAAALPIDAGT
jgi:hypothetical protein